MPHAIELNFDPRTEGLVRELWEQLAELGLSTSMIDSACRPHVTLAVADEVNEPAFREWLRHFTVQLRPLDLLFQAVGCFPSEEAVLFLQPTSDHELLEVHQAFYDSLPDSWQQPHAYYVPGRWVPHCTLATGLDRDRLARALTAVLLPSYPIVGQYQELSLVEIQPGRPVRTVETLGFG